MMHRMQNSVEAKSPNIQKDEKNIVHTIISETKKAITQKWYPSEKFSRCYALGTSGNW